MKTIRKYTAIAVAGIFLANTANAGWMSDFYSSAGAGVSITAPQAIAAQGVVGFSGGGVSWRVPNRNFQPVMITPPSVNFGCNGIDAFLGGFSFPNKDEFVQALRNFGQASVGFFFQLALKSMAPEISITLDAINDIAMRVNQASANTCQLAKAATEALGDKVLTKRTEDASAYASKAGAFVDWFDAKVTLKEDVGEINKNAYMEKYGKGRNHITQIDFESKIPVLFNFLKYALDQSKVNLTTQEKRLVMSIVGPTLIVSTIVAGDGKETIINNGEIATIKFNDLVGTNAFTNRAIENLTVLHCIDAVECTNMAKVTEMHKSFSTLAHEVLDKMTSNISSHIPATNLTADELTVVKLSNVPLYRIASLKATSGLAAAIAAGFSDDLADYAALDAAVSMYTNYLGIADVAMLNAMPKVDEVYHPTIQAMRERLPQLRKEALDTAFAFYKAKGNPYEKIDQIAAAERATYTSLNMMLASNVRFNKRF